MSRSDVVETSGWLLRFTPAQRWVHRGTAVLMGVCLVTAAMLYVGPLAVAIGRRDLVKTIHLYSGLALPLPILLGLAAGSVRQELARLNRFIPADWAWLRSRDRRTGRIPIGKFNPGQKLNAAFVAGAIIVMVATGTILGWPDPWPLRIRQGATFVHDWLAAAIVVMTTGHVYFAARDPWSRYGMRHGLVPIDWARQEHPAWVRPQARSEPPAD
jgi:formate dehydrogenase subunit gamma